MDWSLSGVASPVGGTPATPLATGKLGAGGGLFGFGKRGNEFRIVQLDVGAQGRAFCGGVIGKDGRKMCIRGDCDVGVHRNNKADLSVLVGDILFILTSGPDAPQVSVHLEPRLPSRTMGNLLDRYLEEGRSLDGWDTLFRGLIAASEDDSFSVSEVNNITKRVDGREDQEKFGATPYKKRARLDAGSPALDSNYEVTMVPLDPSLGDTPEEILRNLSTEWRSVVSNIDTLRELVTGSRDMSREMTITVMKEFGEFDFELARLSNLLGARSGDMDPVPIFRSLGDLAKEIKELTSQVEALRDKKPTPLVLDPNTKRAVNFVEDFQNAGVGFKEVNDAISFVGKFAARGGVAETLKAGVCAEVVASFQPIIALFSKLSSDKSTPGDILDKEIANIKSEIAAVRNIVGGANNSASGGSGPQPGSATSGGVSWSLGSMSLGATAGATPGQSAGAATANSAASGQVGATIKALEDRLQDVEDQLQAQTVNMAGITFKSQLLTRSWMTTHAPATGAYIYFLDAHGMLSLAADESETTRAVLNFAHSAVKGGFASSEEAQVSASFKIALPAIFGADSASTRVSADTRALPAMKTPEAWDPEDGYTGAKRRFEEQIKEVKSTMLESVGDHLTGLGRMVAMECISMAYEFLSKLSEWMTKQYRNLVGRGGAKEACWKLISHCVRAIFRDLHKARIAGRGPFLGGDRASGIVWGSLQAHRLMQEYLDADFSAHPKCSHILNIHLQDNALMKVDFRREFDKLKGLVTEVTLDASDLRVQHDNLATKVGKLKK
jgi:hypothetical protein